MGITNRTYITAAQMKNMDLSNLVIDLENPTLNGLVMMLRNKKTIPASFRDASTTIGTILSYQMAEMLNKTNLTVVTPMGVKVTEEIVEQPYLVGLQRAGQPLLEGAWKVFPYAPGGWIDASRSHGKIDELTATVNHYKLAGIEGRNVLLLDIMLATGVSCTEAVKVIKQQGAGQIYFGNVISTEKGIENFHNVHPDVPILTCKIDSRLNEIGYILPGLGDAGDRVFGTYK
jgi:uracil phosphoribosyltransferase